MMLMLFISISSSFCSSPQSKAKRSDSRVTVSRQPAGSGSGSGTKGPSIESQAIIASDVALTSVTLSWEKAEDEETAQKKLKYSLYYSTADNLTSLEEIESNGVVVAEELVDTTTATASDLFPGEVYFFNVVVENENEGRSIYEPLEQATLSDETPPTPGNSATLAAADVLATTLTLNWTVAEDNFTSADNLEYLVVRSTSNNISTLVDAEANGTVVGAYTKNINTLGITGLTDSTTYYFNVIAKDELNNKSVYTSVSQLTTDATAPVAGNSGTITSASVTGTTLTLNWTAATDNLTNASDLQYLVIRSSSNNIATVGDAETNGTAIGIYTANIATLPITGLSDGATYYFTVIVKDALDNKTIYSTLTQAMLDTIAPAPGSAGAITVVGYAQNGVALSWTKGTDAITAQASLQYLVYRSTSAIFDTVAQVKAGTAVGVLTADISSRIVTGLNVNTTYYFNVLIRDAAGNESVYSKATQATSNTKVWNLEVIVGEFVDSACQMTALATDPDGDFYVAYRQHTGKIRIAKYSGGSWAAAADIVGTSITCADSTATPMKLQISSSAGAGILVWTETIATKVVVRSSVLAAGTWGAAVSVSDAAVNTRFFDLAMSSSGEALVTYYQANGANIDAYAKIHVPGSGWGAASALDTSISTPLEGEQQFAAYSEAGVPFTIWRKSNVVYAKSYSAGVWSAAATLSTAGTINANPVITHYGTSGMAAAWIQIVTATNKVHFAIYSSSTGWGTPSASTAGGADQRPVIQGHWSGIARAVWFSGNGTTYSSTYAGTSWSAAETVTGLARSGVISNLRLQLDAVGNAFFSATAGQRLKTAASEKIGAAAWTNFSRVEYTRDFDDTDGTTYTGSSYALQTRLVVNKKGEVMQLALNGNAVVVSRIYKAQVGSAETMSGVPLTINPNDLNNVSFDWEEYNPTDQYVLVRTAAGDGDVSSMANVSYPTANNFVIGTMIDYVESSYTAGYLEPGGYYGFGVLVGNAGGVGLVNADNATPDNDNTPPSVSCTIDVVLDANSDPLPANTSAEIYFSLTVNVTDDNILFQGDPNLGAWVDENTPVTTPAWGWVDINACISSPYCTAVGLNASTNYYIDVRAEDLSGNEGFCNANVTAATLF
jgi:hypothetical protein